MAQNTYIARRGDVMLQRKTMDSDHHWGQDKGSDRERAKAIRDHAGSGSTVPLVEVGVEVEVTGKTITAEQIDYVVGCVASSTTSSTSQVYYDDLPAQKSFMADLYNFLVQRGYL